VGDYFTGDEPVRVAAKPCAMTRIDRADYIVLLSNLPLLWWRASALSRDGAFQPLRPFHSRTPTSPSPFDHSPRAPET